MAQTSVAEVTESTEQTDAQDMLAGYTGEESPTPPEPTATETPESTPTPPEPAPAPPAAPVTLTEQQIKDLLAAVTKINEIEATFGKKFDQTSGQLGRLQQMLTEKTATTPIGKPAPISEDNFKKLKAEFPELSTPLLEELIPVLQNLGGGSSLSEERVVTLLQEQATMIAKDQLTDLREDWEEIVGAKDSDTLFRQWLAVQPLDYQQRVRTTMRPGVLVKAIEQFEAFQRATAPEPEMEPEPAPSKADKSTTAVDRKARLQAAVAPKGKPAPVGASAKTPDDEMREGYNSA